MKKIILLALLSCFLTANAQKKKKKSIKKNNTEVIQQKKAVVYQVFTRLFGNKNTTNKPWGTIEENGVGKFNDFTDKALSEIKKLGATHIWYTGVPHHALVNDYTNIGISNDDPEVVKGRAGSPYAVKDYYSVNPDLAVNPSKRKEEFEALIARTHKNGLQLIIDIVPNHIARKYEGKNNPKGVRDFGADDNTTLEYDRNNNFYYIPGQVFQVPTSENYQPLNGEKNSLIDGKFSENPAKWTGNGSRLAKPDINDWYETVKVNYGIRPDGSKDFPELPASYATKSIKEHFAFWKDKDVPSSWKKFRDIALFWTAKGVDGFRYDMAEMVPYEFWSYMNSAIKMKNPKAFLLAEVYNPKEYRNYIKFGKMDYLYDKVELYDKLKEVTDWLILSIICCIFLTIMTSNVWQVQNLLVHQKKENPCWSFLH
jgi:glycosidase